MPRGTESRGRPWTSSATLLRIRGVIKQHDRLSPGQTLGSYKIVEQIGKGGMGEVYRARDSKLDRDIAIKVLPPELACQPERVRRFEREAADAIEVLY